MLTGKALFNTLLAELNEMGLPGMSATLDEMYRSPDFLELDPLMAIATLVEPEYQKKMNKRIQSRLRAAHLRGCPQELSNCIDSAEREYLLNTPPENRRSDRRSPTARPQKSYTPAVGQTPCV